MHELTEHISFNYCSLPLLTSKEKDTQICLHLDTAEGWDKK